MNLLSLLFVACRWTPGHPISIGFGSLVRRFGEVGDLIFLLDNGNFASFINLDQVY